VVEPLKELSARCQKPRYKEVGNWMVRNILRDAALPVTWLLLHTPVTANQVTLASLAVGLVGLLLFAFPSSTLFLTGALLLQLWYFLDHVDGQIARYRGTASLTGRFFDFVTHHLIHGSLFFSLGVYAYQVTGSFFFVVWGFVASISILLFNLIQDTKYKTFFERVSGLRGLEVILKGEARGGYIGTGEGSYARKVFSLLHKACEIHVLMNILTLASFLEIIFRPEASLRFWLFLFYGIATPLLAGGKITYLILGRKIDEEYEASFQEIRRGDS
jgi:phosphatidylglycerophosphate synthase